MITGGIIALGFGILYYFLDLLPNAAPSDASMFTAVSNVLDALFAWNWLIPAPTIITLLFLSMVFWSAVFAWRFWVWLTKFIFKRS